MPFLAVVCVFACNSPLVDGKSQPTDRGICDILKPFKGTCSSRRTGLYRILGDEIFASCMLRRTSPLKTISVWHLRPLPIGILAMLKKATPLKPISDSQSPFWIYEWLSLLLRRGQCVMIYIVSHLILHFLISDEFRWPPYGYAVLDCGLSSTTAGSQRPLALRPHIPL